jgi:radical SAM superfamily enzyme YgiQ (UPF0313 family)
VKIVLISTYELGHQPFGLASPAAWLRNAGHQVLCLDLSRQPLEESLLAGAGLIAFYVPMHTASRLTLDLLGPVRKANPLAHFAAFGLYAAPVADSLRAHGIQSLFSGEFEPGLVELAEKLSADRKIESANGVEANISLARQKFITPDRTGLPLLRSYAHLVLANGEHRTAGYTEASRGCKHLCRHCPIVPVYNGVFRIVDRDVVLADIRQQVAAGAQHITFGDPDFFNGVGHAIPLVEALHREFPQITYDVTIKVEHLLKHADLLPVLRDTGCLFVISAVESLDDSILQKLEKHHTREDFFRVVEICRRAEFTLQPTFVSFTPWTTFEIYLDLFEQLSRLDLVDSVAPIQLAIRLLIPPGSRLLELPDVRDLVGEFDSNALIFPWRNSDPRLDSLAQELQDIVAAATQQKLSRRATFERMWRAARMAAGLGADPRVEENARPMIPPRAAVPYLNEPWYC